MEPDLWIRLCPLLVRARGQRGFVDSGGADRLWAAHRKAPTVALRKTRFSVLAVVALTGTVAVGTITAASSAAAASPASGDAAAGWLAGQLQDGKMPSTWTPGTTDWGLTADTILALTSRKVAKDAATAATDALESSVRDYISPGGGNARSAGAVAKVALVAQVQGRDATAFGGEDLIATLGSMKSTTAPNIGRYSDMSTGSDWSGAISQSLALLALSRHNSVPTDAVQFLVNLQCPNGGFSYTPDATTGSCASDSDADADVTSFAVQALAADGVAGQPGVWAALTKAGDYLEGVQKVDGSFVESWSQVANASSTGLSAQALKLAGRTAAAAKAATWVGALQVNCENAASGPAAANRGALAYDADGLTTMLASGIDNSNADQFRRTTSQAVLGLDGSDSLAAMSATGASATVPSLTCQAPAPSQPKSAPLAPTIGAIAYAASMQSAKISANAAAGATLYYRVRSGAGSNWSAWASSTGTVSVRASKTARYVEIIARNGDGDSKPTTVLIQSRSSTASRRGCQPIGGVTITHPSSTRAVAKFAARKKACASWRSSSSGRWQTIRRGRKSVSFKVPNAVGVNWQVRTGKRVVSVSVRAPR